MALTPEEQILVDGCRRGDDEAWLALYNAYASDVGLFLRGMLRASDDIDDLVQKVFLEFLSSLDRFRGDASVRTWLHRIARHVALREVRSSSRREHYVRAYAKSVEQRSASPQGRALARHRLALIQQILEQLDPSFREVWVLRELEEMSVAETAEILEVNPATVRTRHLRARKRILAALQELDGPDESIFDSLSPHLKLVSAEGGQP